MGLVVVLDFDGTVTERDVGDELCERFAPPEWREIDAAWDRNEISLPEAQRRMWGLVRCAPEEALAYACAKGTLRGGLDDFLDGARAAGAELWLASGGFDVYIDAILAERRSRFARLFCNRARFTGGTVAVEFPHDDLACGRCAVCKGKVCDQARAAGHRVVFVGDGSSDRCVVGRADRVFAVRGSRLARHLDEQGAAYQAFERFDEIVLG